MLLERLCASGVVSFGVEVINNATEGQPLSVSISGTQDLWWSELNSLRRGTAVSPFEVPEEAKHRKCNKKPERPRFSVSVIGGVWNHSGCRPRVSCGVAASAGPAAGGGGGRGRWTGPVDGAGGRGRWTGPVDGAGEWGRWTGLVDGPQAAQKSRKV